MTKAKLAQLSCAACLLIMVAQEGRAQVPPDQHLLVRELAPGSVVVDGGRPGANVLALDELARWNGRIAIYSRFFAARGGISRSAPTEMPVGLEGIRRLAEGAGFATAALSGRIVLVRDPGDDDEPILITAQALRGDGGGLAGGIPLEELEWELLSTAQNSIRNNVHGGLFGPAWIATYYWPTPEGQGREYYVQQQSSTGRTVNGLPQRYLRKVRVGVGAGGGVTVADLWTNEQGILPQAIHITGPAVNVEVDFDRDGVTDLVCLSGVIGEQFGGPPLIVLSGKTGRVMGALDGYEFVVYKCAGGDTRVASLDAFGFRSYILSDQDHLALARSGELQAGLAEPLGKQARAGTGVARLLGLDGPVQVVDDFVLPRKPGSLLGQEVGSVRVLEPIGEMMSLPASGLGTLPGLRVLLDHRPSSQSGGAERE